MWMTLLWIAGGIVGLLVLGLIAMYVQGKLSRRRLRREWREQDARMSDAERAAASAERRRSRLMLQLGHGGTGAMLALRECTARDTGILLSAFSLGDWQTRELVMAALGNLCRDNKPGEDYDPAEMVSALRSIRALCSADSTGGSHRDACLDHARMLLDRPELQAAQSA